MSKKIVIRYMSVMENADHEQVLGYLAKRFETNAATIELFLQKPKSKMRVVYSRSQADEEIARLEKYGIVAMYDGQHSVVGRTASFGKNDDDLEDRSMTCPKCGLLQTKADSCISCKVTLAKYGQKQGSSMSDAAYAIKQAPDEEIKPDYGFKLGEFQGLINMAQVALLVGAGYLLAKYVL